MSKTRWTCGLAAATVTTLGFAATALATGNQLSVKGPIAAAQGVSYQITTSGYASHPAGRKGRNPANFVVGWRTPTVCESDYKSELSALGPSATPDLSAAVKGSFTQPVTLTAGGGGTVYWCAYLINHTTMKTFKFAGWRYAELGRPGGPGGGGPPGAP